MQLVCKKCGYAWQYAGNKHRTSCSKCKTSITIKSQPQIVDGSKKHLITASHHTTLTNHSIQIPIELLNSLAFNRAIQWAKTNGEDYITLKANSEGILSL